jgi:hypothetical protein
VPDFAATLQLGMRPVALVQGCSVIGWHWYGKGSPYLRPRYFARDEGRAVLTTYSCPHLPPLLPGHWTWGENFEQPWKTRAWQAGFDAAHERMMESATRAGAHGVIGVVDTSTDQAAAGLREIRVVGTAVVLDGEDPPPSIWSCRLPGQMLAKLIEAGLSPVSVVGAMSSVRSWAVCTTKMLMEGDYDELANTSHRVKAGSPITQIADAHMQARRLARDGLAAVVGPDMLYGGVLEIARRGIRAGDIEVECVLRGSRVRRREHHKPDPPTVMVTLR